MISSILRTSALLVCSLAIGLSAGSNRLAAAAPSEDHQDVLRLDPVNDRYVPVPPAERKVGYIYSHFDPQLQRRVWAIFEGNGAFSVAMGAGSIYPAFRLDVRTTVAEATMALRRIAPRLAEAIAKPGGTARVYVRLGADNQWELYGPFGLESFFNPDTGRRWEKHGRDYIPIVHTTGYRWTVRRGRYVPAP
jgi:hypothetical protein